MCCPWFQNTKEKKKIKCSFYLCLSSEFLPTSPHNNPQIITKYRFPFLFWQHTHSNMPSHIHNTQFQNLIELASRGFFFIKLEAVAYRESILWFCTDQSVTQSCLLLSCPLLVSCTPSWKGHSTFVWSQQSVFCLSVNAAVHSRQRAAGEMGQPCDVFITTAGRYYCLSIMLSFWQFQPINHENKPPFILF